MKKGYNLPIPACKPFSSFHFPSFPSLFLLFFLVLTFVGTQITEAGSWPLERKATYLSLGYRGFNGQQYYGGQGEKLGLQRLEEQTLTLYSEYGYSKNISGIVSVPAFRKLFAQVSPDSPLLSVQSPGDVELGMRYAIWPGANNVVTFTALFGIPLGEATQTDGLWAGDNEYNQLIKLGYGHSFDGYPLYIHVESGYNFRSGGFSDEIHFGVEVGFRPWDPLELLLRLRTVSSQGNGDPDFHGGSFGFSSNNQSYLMFGPELAFWLSDGMGLNLGVYSISQARNMPAMMAVTTGVFFIISSPTGE
ncbi:MAG: hypothetical protein IH600_11010 [Bacteroidetes bacterium]|nr:hypothetical protein [Bacteroidota bacterium]